jgi:hypothetical protein
MTHDAATLSRGMLFRIYAVLLLVVAIVALAVVLFGLPALGITGLLLTAGFFGLMLLFMAGN